MGIFKMNLPAIAMLLVSISAIAADPFAGAKWIGENPQPVYGAMTNAYATLGPGPRLPKNAIRLRKVFRLPEGRIRSAKANVTGLGLYELHVNGENVQPDRILAPSWSNPDFRVHYDSPDVKPFLKAGVENAVGIWLAPGYSDDFANYCWRWLKSKRAIFSLDVVYENGETHRIVSDGTWEWTDRQPLAWVSLYNGERYDARMEDPDWAKSAGSRAKWRPVAELDAPRGKLMPDGAPPVTLGPKVRPVKTWLAKSGRKIFDFGGNCSAVPEIKVRLPEGTKLTMFFTEEAKDGDLDFRSHRGLIQRDVYTAAGRADGETYRPNFTYHGFRYVGIEGGDVEEICVREITAKLREIASFESSDPMLNWLWDAARRSMRSNFVAYPTDCNMRTERTPCLMDSNVYEDTAFQTYDIADYYERWLFDSVRYQYGFGKGDEGGNTWNPDWQGESILLAERFLEFCAATNSALREYPSLVKIADRFLEKSKSGIWEGGGFGDWLPKNDGHPFSTPKTMNTMLLHKCLGAMAKLSKLRGDGEASEKYASRAELVRRKFIEKYVDAKTGKIGEGTAGEHVLAIAFGMVPEEMKGKALESLKRRIEGTDETHFCTGIYGTRWIGDVLLENGLGDLWLEMMHKETYPGFGYMRAFGATSLWEDWKPYGGALGMQSHNHAMRAGAVTCFLTHLGGIRPLADGYSKVLIRSCCPKGLERVKVVRELPQGKVTVAWKRSGGKIRFDIDTPPGLDVRIEFPPEG